MPTPCSTGATPGGPVGWLGRCSATPQTLTTWSPRCSRQRSGRSVAGRDQPTTSGRTSCARSGGSARGSWRRRARRRESPSDDLDVVDDEQHDFEERAVLQQAFNALPSHLRQVLWMTEVERLSHAEVAERTTSTSQAVAAMAMRARNALAEQYLAAHVAPSTPPECAGVRRTLARTVRGTASRRQQRRVAEHLACCRECAPGRAPAAARQPPAAHAGAARACRGVGPASRQHRAARAASRRGCSGRPLHPSLRSPGSWRRGSRFQPRRPRRSARRPSPPTSAATIRCTRARQRERRSGPLRAPAVTDRPRAPRRTRAE